MKLKVQAQHYLKLAKFYIDRLPVTEQYELAKTLAANCGYQLVAEDTERSLEIKELIRIYKFHDPSTGTNLIIEGLEALLK